MEAIILKKTVYSEGNEIVTLFTRDGGKIRATARAIKSSKSRLAFGLQALFYSDVDLAPSKKIPVIKGVKVLDAFRKIRENVDLVYCALYAVEIILKSTADEQPNSELFNLVLEYFRHLDTSENTEHLCTALFGLRALAATGYELHYNRCLVCEKTLEQEFQIGFSNFRGGFLCSEHLRSITDGTQIRLELWRFLKESQYKDFSDIDTAAVPKSEIQGFVNSFVTYILERNLNLGKYVV